MGKAQIQAQPLNGHISVIAVDKWWWGNGGDRWWSACCKYNNMVSRIPRLCEGRTMVGQIGYVSSHSVHR